jgi:hypothetical protein
MMKSLSQYIICELSITRRANKLTKSDPLFVTRLANSLVLSVPCASIGEFSSYLSFTLELCLGPNMPELAI